MALTQYEHGMVIINCYCYSAKNPDESELDEALQNVVRFFMLSLSSLTYVLASVDGDISIC